MDGIRKRAYRYLLYRAMLDIRPLAWNPIRCIQLLTPWHRRREMTRVQRAGDLADWLHNMAMFSAHDFDGFKESWFWKEYDGFQSRHPEYRFSDYKAVFERVLSGREGAYGS